MAYKLSTWVISYENKSDQLYFYLNSEIRCLQPKASLVVYGKST